MKKFLLGAALLACLSAGTDVYAQQKVMARHVPERSDDFVWENDFVCFRVYGKALEGNPTSPGFDIWVKRPGDLVADRMYRDELQNHKSYHKDWGYGKDCYKVAVSLGGGASVPVIDGKFEYPATNYRSYEILEKSDKKIVFVLHYPEWTSDGEMFKLDKKITVKSGSHFCKVEDTYTFYGKHDRLEIAAGVFRHNESQTIESEMTLSDRYAIWEHASDTAVEPEEGMIGVAVYVPHAEYSGLSKDQSHGIVTRTVKSGEAFTYWFGSCWSKGNVKSAEKWFKLVKKLH